MKNLADIIKQENLNQAGDLASKMFDIIFEENPSLCVAAEASDIVFSAIRYATAQSPISMAHINDEDVRFLTDKMQK